MSLSVLSIEVCTNFNTKPNNLYLVLLLYLHFQKIHFIHIVQQLTCFEKYHCISGELEKHKLLLIQLDEIYVNLINSQKSIFH